MSFPPTLGFVRTLMEQALTDVCSLIQPGPIIVLPSGGTQQGDPIVHSGVACRLASAQTQASIASFGPQLTSQAAWDLHLAIGTPVEPGWTATLNGETYAVIAVSEPTGAALRQALLRSGEPI